MLNVNSRSLPASRTLKVYSRTSSFTSKPRYCTMTLSLIFHLCECDRKRSPHGLFFGCTFLETLREQFSVICAILFLRLIPRLCCAVPLVSGVTDTTRP